MEVLTLPFILLRSHQNEGRRRTHGTKLGGQKIQTTQNKSRCAYAANPTIKCEQVVYAEDF
jgi:hypothetical protein